MMRVFFIFGLFNVFLQCVQLRADQSERKPDVLACVDRLRPDLIELGAKIWAYAETSLRETNSARALADFAERQGLKVQRGVARLPTAFIASYGQGKPIIGIVGEYDALPGLSQKAVAEK